MLKRTESRFGYSTLMLCLLALPALPSQESHDTSKMDIKVKVAARNTGEAIENAKVTISLGRPVSECDKPHSECPNAVTDENGIAKLNQVRKGTVSIKVAAVGYETRVVTKVELAHEEPPIEMPIKIELETLSFRGIRKK